MVTFSDMSWHVMMLTNQTGEVVVIFWSNIVPNRERKSESEMIRQKMIRQQAMTHWQKAMLSFHITLSSKQYIWCKSSSIESPSGSLLLQSKRINFPFTLFHYTEKQTWQKAKAKVLALCCFAEVKKPKLKPASHKAKTEALALKTGFVPFTLPTDWPNENGITF